ncbi:cytochrome P450 [Arthrobacter sp. I2-34]|uniref:Cytochrome P450 n=1 Tax=Arthrobacter hankyongi TaxID=2904801 RepID=A0ABS9L3V5_9MICC|nr:cytochrome P450 [Arthrobacter hankyongi]MCG2621291.1 cytochrome P450 [Arthrobacter hankyongi]
MTEATKSPVLDIVKVNSDHGHAQAYAELREHGPVVRGEAFGGYWAVVSYDAIRRAANDVGNLCSGQGSTIPALGTAFRPIPVEVDPPDHRKYRQLLVPVLRPEKVAEWEDLIRRETDIAIDRFIEAGSADLMEIARYVPPAVIAFILGVSDEGPTMVKLTADLNNAATAGDPEAKKAANMALFQFVDQIVTDAEGTDRDDMLGMIANAQIDGAPIGHMKAVAMAVTVVIAGQETTVNGISSALWLVAAHQEVKQRLIENPELIPNAVEESLRLETPVQMMGRTATTDIELEGVRITEGERVGLAWGAANVDPAKFEDPEKFNIDRPNNPHVAFGHGIHRCAGEHLARAEMRIALEQVLARMPDYRLAGEVELGTSGAMNRGAHSVPVTFTPGARAYQN